MKVRAERVGAVVAFSALMGLSGGAAAFSDGAGEGVGGLQPLTAAQMSAVQGQSNALLTIPVADENPDSESLSLDTLEYVARVLVPVMGLLTSDSSVQGVHFATDAAIRVREDGALELPMPSRIERITLDNLRLAGSNNSLGNITIRNIRFHPDSRMAISAY
ncbi:MAG: hypothetical protein R3296_15030 [Oleiphilaceae bacterium]|nr:hypothetical protein [Oleiphilaceae bacterium]